MPEERLAKTGIKTNYTEKSSYDLVIIGAGVAGLTTGLLWLKNRPEDSVLIVEKEPYPGGYVTAYKRGGFVFETTQLFPDVIDIVDFLGVEIPLKRYEGNFMRRLVVDGDDVKEYHLPTGAENLKNHLCGLFPEDAGKIGKLMDYSVNLFAQVRKLKAISTAKDKLLTPFAAPKVVANLNTTQAQLLDRFGITNPNLREIMETFTSFAGVSPGYASSILTTGAMLSSVSRCYRPYGYFDGFPAAMAELFQKRGGEIRLKAPVEAIQISGGKAEGIRVAGDSLPIKAERVVSTVDPNVLIHNMVGDERVPSSYLDKLNNTVMSPSSLNIALGLDDGIDMSSMDLDYPYNLISTGLGTADKLFNAFLENRNAFSEECFHMAVICPSLTTGGKTTVTLRVVPVAPGDWLSWKQNDPARYAEEKEKWGGFFVGLAEKYLIPGLSSHIEVMDVATPATYARYSGSPTGSLYDMASLVTQFGPKRLGLKTPIENLVQPKFSHGIYGSMMGAVQVVDLMLDRTFNEGKSLFAPGK